MERKRIARIANDRNGNEIILADGAVCRIEIDPTGARQIHLRPGMSRAGRTLFRLGHRDGEVSGHEPGGETECSIISMAKSRQQP